MRIILNIILAALITVFFSMQFMDGLEVPPGIEVSMSPEQEKDFSGWFVQIGNRTYDLEQELIPLGADNLEIGSYSVRVYNPQKELMLTKSGDELLFEKGSLYNLNIFYDEYNDNQLILEIYQIESVITIDYFILICNF